MGHLGGPLFFDTYICINQPHRYHALQVFGKIEQNVIAFFYQKGA